MGRPEIRVVAIFEDQAHESFLRALSKRLGLRPLRLENCHNNDGVLQRLGREVDALRERSFQRNLGLVVVIDADDKGVRGRVDELLGRIERDASSGSRREDERIALVVPAREIENWYVHLCCPDERPIDEAADYKPTAAWRELEKNIGASARKAAEVWVEEAGRDAPPSMSAAREELERVQ